MLLANTERIEAVEGLVLDVGGWANPLGRADWVIDLEPYETRGLYGTPPSERFTADTWVQRDICAKEPWPFDDDQFDFVVCSHTLEDVRDPIWVCDEMVRVAKAGYLEVPSRIEEHMTGLSGTWAGWAHHRWVCDVDPYAPSIDFVFKSHAIHARTLPKRDLPPERRVQWLFWEGAFSYRERILGSIEEHDAYFDEPLHAVF